MKPETLKDTKKYLLIIALMYNKICYLIIQCCLSQRVLPGTAESRTDHPHLEARETAYPTCQKAFYTLYLKFSKIAPQLYLQG
jgi:hypothetical protein